MAINTKHIEAKNNYLLNQAKNSLAQPNPVIRNIALQYLVIASNTPSTARKARAILQEFSEKAKAQNHQILTAAFNEVLSSRSKL